MIIKKEQNMEYGMWNMEYWIQFLLNSKFNILNSTRRGFTLVETLVAISILLIAVVGPISLIGDALHKLYYAKDEMVALNLAQEGIEVVRRVRDNNMLGVGSTWSNLHDGVGAKNGYVVDVGRINDDEEKQYFRRCSVSTCSSEKVVFIENNTGLYRQGSFTGVAGFTPTQFKRFVQIDKSSNNSDERVVTSIVEWRTGGKTGNITISENIFELE